jgi:hypothetical protein
MPITLTAATALAAQHPDWWATLVSWGNIGSLLGGLAAIGLAIAAVITGTAGLGDWRAKQREQAAVAREEAENIRLDRQRVLLGWSSHGVAVYGVKLVTEPAEMDNARRQLSSNRPTDYVILRVSESANGNENRALSLRQLIETTGYLARAPERGEYEALELGRRALLDNPSSAVPQG